jgi:hypothetical protein
LIPETKTLRMSFVLPDTAVVSDNRQTVADLSLIIAARICLYAGVDKSEALGLSALLSYQSG